MQVHQDRRQKLLLEARRERLAWVNEAALCQLEGQAALRFREEAALFDPNGAIARILPSAREFLDLLTELEGQCQTQSICTQAQANVAAPDNAQHESDVAYQSFLRLLKEPSSADLVVAMKQFVKSLQGKGQALTTPTEFLRQSAMFHHKISEQLQQHEPWKRQNAEEWLCTRKALERFLFHKLYDVAWRIIEDKGADQRLSARLQQLDFLTFEHLDLPAPLKYDTPTQQDGAPDSELNTTALWQQAEEQLLQVSQMTWPEGKVAKIIRCAELVVEYLKGHCPQHYDPQENNPIENDKPGLRVAAAKPPPGADDLLPALILLVKTTKPAQLHSNLAFIEAYSDKLSWMSRSGFVATNLASAAHFLENVKAADLSISPEEFSEGLKRCQQAAEEVKTQDQVQQNNQGQISQSTQYTNFKASAECSSGKMQVCGKANIPNKDSIMIKEIPISVIRAERRKMLLANHPQNISQQFNF